ncbi:hypothetical protein [Mycoplasma buteonis]|uniref:hypothetical protein n=1 Tax=Mycoplasma buteonis TaxID=171280 RepID=UPI00055DE4CF|nr:hypothetical protein [Mycoplasma buteonis]
MNNKLKNKLTLLLSTAGTLPVAVLSASCENNEKIKEPNYPQITFGKGNLTTATEFVNKFKEFTVDESLNNLKSEVSTLANDFEKRISIKDDNQLNLKWAEQIYNILYLNIVMQTLDVAFSFMQNEGNSLDKRAITVYINAFEVPDNSNSELATLLSKVQNDLKSEDYNFEQNKLEIQKLFLLSAKNLLQNVSDKNYIFQIQTLNFLSNLISNNANMLTESIQEYPFLNILVSQATEMVNGVNSKIKSVTKPQDFYTKKEMLDLILKAANWYNKTISFLTTKSNFKNFSILTSHFENNNKFHQDFEKQIQKIDNTQNELKNLTSTTYSQNKIYLALEKSSESLKYIEQNSKGEISFSDELVLNSVNLGYTGEYSNLYNVIINNLATSINELLSFLGTNVLNSAKEFVKKENNQANDIKSQNPIELLYFYDNNYVEFLKNIDSLAQKNNFSNLEEIKTYYEALLNQFAKVYQNYLGYLLPYSEKLGQEFQKAIQKFGIISSLFPVLDFFDVSVSALKEYTEQNKPNIFEEYSQKFNSVAKTFENFFLNPTQETNKLIFNKIQELNLNLSQFYEQKFSDSNILPTLNYFESYDDFESFLNLTDANNLLDKEIQDIERVKLPEAEKSNNTQNVELLKRNLLENKLLKSISDTQGLNHEFIPTLETNLNLGHLILSNNTFKNQNTDNQNNSLISKLDFRTYILDQSFGASDDWDNKLKNTFLKDDLEKVYLLQFNLSLSKMESIGFSPLTVYGNLITGDKIYNFVNLQSLSAQDFNISQENNQLNVNFNLVKTLNNKVIPNNLLKVLNGNELFAFNQDLTKDSALNLSIIFKISKQEYDLLENYKQIAIPRNISAVFYYLKTLSLNDKTNLLKEVSAKLIEFINLNNFDIQLDSLKQLLGLEIKNDEQFVKLLNTFKVVYSNTQSKVEEHNTTQRVSSTITLK